MSFPECPGDQLPLYPESIVEMVHSLRAIDREAFQLLTKKRFEDFWIKINGSFLLTLFAGILTSLFFVWPRL